MPSPIEPLPQVPCPNPGHSKRRRLPAVREPAEPTNPTSPPNRKRSHRRIETPDVDPDTGRRHSSTEQSSPQAPTRVGREWREPWLPKGVRRVKGGRRFQLRVYVGPRVVYPVNFGIYPSAYEAGRVAKRVWHLLARGASIWDTLLSLIAAGEVSPQVSAKWVYQVPGGWGVRARQRGASVSLPGPYRTAGEARAAARVSLSRTRAAAACPGA
jgi:hypothetical protein